MTVHFAVGFMLATRFQPGNHGSSWVHFGLGVLAWVGFLSSGNMALNTSCDNDTGDIGYVPKPPRPPKYLWLFSMGLLLGGHWLAFSLSARFGLLYLVAAILAVAYSVPPVRLKGVPGMDWLVNVVGYGALTPLAGWAVTTEPLTAWFAALVVGFGLLFGGLYPLTQLYQIPADRAAGTRTMAVALGVRRSLMLSIMSASIGFALLVSAVFLHPKGTPLRLILLAPSFVMWARPLAGWWRKREDLGTAEHQRRMYQVGNAWFWTGPIVLAAFLLELPSCKTSAATPVATTPVATTDMQHEVAAARLADAGRGNAPPRRSSLAESHPLGTVELRVHRMGTGTESPGRL